MNGYSTYSTLVSYILYVFVFYFGSFLFVLFARARVDAAARLTGGEIRSDLHADGFKRVPAALPVHPHHAVVCAVFGHVPRVSPAHVVSAVGIG